MLTCATAAASSPIGPRLGATCAFPLTCSRKSNSSPKSAAPLSYHTQKEQRLTLPLKNSAMPSRANLDPSRVSAVTVRPSFLPRMPSRPAEARSARYSSSDFWTSSGSSSSTGAASASTASGPAASAFSSVMASVWPSTSAVKISSVRDR